MNAELAIKSVQGESPRKRTMSRSEADEMLEQKKFPLRATLSNGKLKAIGIYVSQIIGRATNGQENQLKKVSKIPKIKIDLQPNPPVPERLLQPLMQKEELRLAPATADPAAMPRHPAPDE